jgi:hypothetical protein
MRGVMLNGASDENFEDDEPTKFSAGFGSFEPLDIVEPDE